MEQGVACEVCGMQRAPGLIHKVPSKLIKGMNLLMCDVCSEKGWEPRAHIIIVGRKYGYDRVRPWIKDRRYPGEEITVRQLFS